MKLMHYADHRVELKRCHVYTQDKPHGYGKPAGFWVSVAGEDDWASWCRNEEYSVDCLKYEHLVTLRDAANILHVSNPVEFDKFHAEYKTMTDYDRRYHRDDPLWWAIDWDIVTGKYDGIIIAPYLWKRRLTEATWYYGWDCASGCIWNLEAIESVNCQ